MDRSQPSHRSSLQRLPRATVAPRFSSDWPRRWAQESAWDLPRRYQTMVLSPGEVIPLFVDWSAGPLTALGGVGHTLPFLIRSFSVAFAVAFGVVVVELGVITWIRHRYMDTPVVSAGLQVFVGGALVFLTGILIGSS